MKAVLFDALGTLVRLLPPWPLLVDELRFRGVTVTEGEARAALLAEIAYYRAHHHEARDAESLADLRARCTGVLAATLPARARVLSDLDQALLASLRFEPYPEAEEVLTGLRLRGTKVVVVSNWDVSLHEVLAGGPLGALVDAAITSAEHGTAKPDPTIFHAALELAGGVAPEHALHVGDSLEADVDGARAAGIEPVLVVRDGGPAPAGVRVARDLREALPA